jgi:glutathione S-transferase
MKLTLISHVLCPYVQRAAIALAEKGVAYERIDIDLRDKPQWFLALSPTGKTPLLRVGDEAIFESAVICEFLEDTVAPALYPADPLQRARYRAWIEFASGTLNGIWSLYTAKDDAGLQTAYATLAQRFARLEQVVEGPYFAGERFSLVDAAFAPVFRYFELFDGVIDDLFGGLPKVRAWREALARRPSVMQAVGPDYHEGLRAFVVAQEGVLGRSLTPPPPA